MSRKYRFGDPTDLYFVSYATVGWIDVFTRNEYRQIVVDSVNHCIARIRASLYRPGA